jgi:hypothetical protein
LEVVPKFGVFPLLPSLRDQISPVNESRHHCGGIHTAAADKEELENGIAPIESPEDCVLEGVLEDER